MQDTSELEPCSIMSGNLFGSVPSVLDLGQGYIRLHGKTLGSVRLGGQIHGISLLMRSDLTKYIRYCISGPSGSCGTGCLPNRSACMKPEHVQGMHYKEMIKALKLTGQYMKRFPYSGV